MSGATFPCPCCGHQVFDRSPGSYEICPVCFWEDDNIQLRFPIDLEGGANRTSLFEAQRNYALFGAKDAHARRHVRPAHEDKPVEPGWRSIEPGRDSFEKFDDPRRSDWPTDWTTLYWWRPTFWRISASREA